MTYDCVNGSCILSSEYNTPGLYDTLTDCENAVNNGSVKPVLIFNPLWSANKHVKLPLLVNKLGDGYQQTIFQGFNLIPEEWDITSPIFNSQQADDLLNQLRQLCASSFLWSPNNGLITYQEFTCDDWQKARLGLNNYQITTKFTMTILGSGLIVATPPSNQDIYFNNVVLLVQPTGSIISDLSPSAKAITNNGGATASGGYVNFSQYTYLSLGNYSDFGYGTGDFTNEAWINFSNTSKVNDFIIFNPSGYAINSGVYMDCSVISNKMNIWNGSDHLSNGTFSSNSLTHLAWSRVDGTMYYFINGSLDRSFSFTNDLGSSQYLNIGENADTTKNPLGSFSLRLTKGVGRYTSSFTPPSTFPTS